MTLTTASAVYWLILRCVGGVLALAWLGAAVLGAIEDGIEDARRELLLRRNRP